MTIRFGVIGTGFTRGTQLPILQLHPETSVVGICSRTAEKAESTAAAFNIPYWTVDYRQLLEQDLDAVVITTPTVYHAEMTLAACQRGLHVLCEKPMAMHADEAESMLRAAERANVVHMIDHEFRYVPAQAHLTQLLQERAIGDLLMVAVTGFSGFNRDPYAYTHNWLAESSMGGGLLGALGSHQVDALRVWCGEIAAVSGLTSTFVRHRWSPAEECLLPVTSDDSYACTLRFHSGTVGSMVFTSVAGSPRPTEVCLVGADGTLRLSNHQHLFLTLPGGSEQELNIPEVYCTLPQGISADDLDPRFWLQGPFLRLLDRFVQAIQGGRAPDGPTFRDGLKIQQCLDAVRRTESGWQLLP